MSKWCVFLSVLHSVKSPLSLWPSHPTSITALRHLSSGAVSPNQVQTKRRVEVSSAVDDAPGGTTSSKREAKHPERQQLSNNPNSSKETCKNTLTGYQFVKCFISAAGDGAQTKLLLHAPSSSSCPSLTGGSSPLVPFTSEAARQLGYSAATSPNQAANDWWGAACCDPGQGLSLGLSNPPWNVSRTVQPSKECL